MTRPLIAVAALALVLALGGCGGGRGSSVSRADYIARADRICADTSRQAAPLLQRLAAGATGLTRARARALAPVAARLHAIGRTYVARLAALPRPSADRAVLTRFIDGSRQVVAAIGDATTALAGGRPLEVLGTLQNIQGTAAAANAAASAYGFHDCATVLTAG